MRRILTPSLVFLIVTICCTCVTYAAERVEICHREHIITVAVHALPAHLQHGDHLVQPESCDGRDNDCDGEIDEQACCPVPVADLCSWWPGEGNARDVIGSNDGTLERGAGFAPGCVGQAFAFDGFDDTVLVPDTLGGPCGLDFTGDFTIEAWVHLQDQSVRDHWVFGNTNIGDLAGYSLSLHRDEQRLRFDLVSNPLFLSATGVTTNEWAHVAAVREGKVGRLYLNGAVMGTAMVPSGSTENETPVTIGALYDTRFNPPIQTGSTFQGLIDEVRTYRRALTDQEILAIYLVGCDLQCELGDDTEQGEDPTD